MNAYFTPRRAVIVAAAGLVAALSFGGVAQAITDTVFRYSPPKTGYYSIDHFAMNPLGSGAADSYFREFSTGLNNTTGNDCFGTGVNLPHGVTLTEVRVWYKSGAGTPRFYFVFQRMSIAQQNYYLRSPTDSSGTLKATNLPIDPVKIDNSLNSYAFVLCIDPGDVFYSARISYTYNNAGD